MNDDINFLKTTLKIEISDMIFNHHMKSQNIINIVLICSQLVAMVIGIITTLCGVSISKYTAVYNLAVCLVVMLNIFVHNKTWNKAKSVQHDKIDKMIDVIMSNDTYAEKQYKLCKLRGLHVIYPKEDLIDFLEVKEEDKYLNQLKINWVHNAKLNCSTGVNDARGYEYHTGDIVYNPAFGDYWLVEEVDNETMKEYGADIPFLFTLYGNPDEYAMCINEPEGFTIEARVNDFSYTNMLSRFVRIYKQHREEEAEWEREAKEEDKINEQTNSEETNEQEIND